MCRPKNESPKSSYLAALLCSIRRWLSEGFRRCWPHWTPTLHTRQHHRIKLCQMAMHLHAGPTGVLQLQQARLTERIFHQGVPQGSILPPQLFNLYVSIYTETAELSTSYADISTAIASSKKVEETNRSCKVMWQILVCGWKREV